MKILITGNLGYVGPVLMRHLRRVFPQSTLIGYDTGYFAHCLTNAAEFPERLADVQYWGDVRNIHPAVLEGVDAVVQLAAVSNDPMGNRFESVTEAINYASTRDLAQAAKKAGVKRFVFASSCSMYGFAEGGPRKETDDLNPLTAYARSKVASEKALQPLAEDSLITTSLRFSTACGMSERLRLDLVLNDFVACALASREITVLSDGTPWRPLIDVRDMARAIEWALIREPASTGGSFLAVNVGADRWNYQVKDLAHAVAQAVEGTRVSINLAAPPDKRSYRVDFSLFKQLAPDHQPQINLADSIQALKDGLSGMNFNDPNFRSSQFMRLKVLERHMAEGRLGEDLYWKKG